MRRWIANRRARRFGITAEHIAACLKFVDDRCSFEKEKALLNSGDLTLDVVETKNSFGMSIGEVSYHLTSKVKFDGIDYYSLFVKNVDGFSLVHLNGARFVIGDTTTIGHSELINEFQKACIVLHESTELAVD